MTIQVLGSIDLNVLVVTPEAAASDRLLFNLLTFTKRKELRPVSTAKWLGSYLEELYKSQSASGPEEMRLAWANSIEAGLKDWVREHPNRAGCSGFEADNPETHGEAVRDMIQYVRLMCTATDSLSKISEFAYPSDVVVVDEVSMLTEPALAEIVTAVKPTVKVLILAGDPAQGNINLASRGKSPLASLLGFSPLDRIPKLDSRMECITLRGSRRQVPQLIEFVNKTLCKPQLTTTRSMQLTCLAHTLMENAVRGKSLGFAGKLNLRWEVFVSVNGYDEEVIGQGSWKIYDGAHAVSILAKKIAAMTLARTLPCNIVVLTMLRSDVQEIREAFQA